MRRANGRLTERGLLEVTGDRPYLTADGNRALEGGYAILELEAFDASQPQRHPPASRLESSTRL
jgi:hypothetical protein